MYSASRMKLSCSCLFKLRNLFHSHHFLAESGIISFEDSLVEYTLCWTAFSSFIFLRFYIYTHFLPLLLNLSEKFNTLNLIWASKLIVKVAKHFNPPRTTFNYKTWKTISTFVIQWTKKKEKKNEWNRHRHGEQLYRGFCCWEQQFFEFLLPFSYISSFESIKSFITTMKVNFMGYKSLFMTFSDSFCGMRGKVDGGWSENFHPTVAVVRERVQERVDESTSTN